MYEARCTLHDMEFRRFNLIPEKGWEVDLDQVEQLADENTVAIVLISPNNPCGNVYTYDHLEKV
jgi:aspartate/methionine/tyrosine aminotransferase